MTKKVIYISWSKLTDRIARDYFVDHLIGNGVEVEFWDIGVFTREPHNEFGELDVNYLRVLQSYSEYENLVKRKENIDAIYVPLISLHWNVRRVFRILSKYKCKLILVSWGMSPIATAPMWQRAAIKLAKEPMRFFQMLFEIFCLYNYRKLGLIKPFDVVFTAGSVLGQGTQFAKKNISLNSCDHEHYIRSKESDNSFDREKHAVFLDINLPFQSDFSLTNTKTVNPHDYYGSLERFFTLLEEQYKVKIIIAAHPKTNPNTRVFGKRKIHRLKTAEIVKDAEFVITHHSTSLNYAVFNSKACIFIYTNEMEELYPNGRVRAIKSLASYLDASVYNIDQLPFTDKIVIKQPNQKRYDDFKYSYLISKETESLSSKDIFLREINKN